MMVELFMIHYVILAGYLRKGKCMKRSIQLPLIVLTSLLVIPLSYATPHKDLRQAHLSRCAKPVFYAQTANHKKEVEICIVSPSVSYSFGKVGVEKKRWISLYLQTELHLLVKVIGFIASVSLLYVMVILPILSVMAVMKKVSLLAPSMSIKDP